MRRRIHASAITRRATAGHGETVAYLNQVLSLSLGNEGLELGSGEGVDETGFRNDKKQDLSSCENRELVSLVSEQRVSD